MAFSLRIPLLGSWLLLGVVPTCTARAAAPSSEGVVEARRQRAKLEFKRGSDLYEAGQYEESISAFMAADQLAPSAALSFNIARAYERVSDTSGALRWYRDYLRRYPQAPNAAEVQGRIGEFSKKLSKTGLQQLTVLSTPEGAIVTIDGRAVGVAPFTGDLSLGKHRVQLALPGYRELGYDIELLRSAPQDLNVKMSEQPRQQATTPSAQPTLGSTTHDGSRRFGVAPWFVAGAGAAGLGGALGFELARRSNEEAARNATTQLQFKAQSDAMLHRQAAARILGGVGGALFVTGTVLLLLNEQTPDAPRVGIGCTFKGCTASARGSF